MIQQIATADDNDIEFCGVMLATAIECCKRTVNNPAGNLTLTKMVDIIKANFNNHQIYGRAF